MSKFTIGKQYKLSGAPITDKAFQQAIDTILTIPDVWTCTGTREAGCWSASEGVLFLGTPAEDAEGWYIAQDSLLEDGTVVEVLS